MGNWKIYTDGGCSPNPGPGGWGYVVVENGEPVHECFGGEPHSTNNRMELTAIIEALNYCQKNAEQWGKVTIYSDSNLCVQTYNTWMSGWEKRGWKRSKGPVVNLDLVKQLAAMKKRSSNIQLVWIKAHNGETWNEYADRLTYKGRPSV
ncbi:MAG: ribonuclease H [Synechococcus sp.]